MKEWYGCWDLNTSIKKPSSPLRSIPCNTYRPYLISFFSEFFTMALWLDMCLSAYFGCHDGEITLRATAPARADALYARLPSLLEDRALLLVSPRKDLPNRGGVVERIYIPGAPNTPNWVLFTCCKL